MNPMTPQNDTQNAVRTAMRMSMFLLNLRESIPRYMAWFSPRSIVFRFLALNRMIPMMTATGMVMSIVSDHSMLAKLPNIHDEMFARWFALNDMMRVVPALSPIPMTVPPRT